MHPTNLHLRKSCPSALGFSLVELLVVIMILGIMVNLAVVTLGSARQGAEDQKDKRNAQEIASVAAIANAAGAHFVVQGDERGTIAKLRDGISPPTGAFRGRTFRIPDMADAEITGAMRFLALNDDSLQFNMVGTGGR